MYKCCIFDLDGTLLNTVHALNRTINLTLARFGEGPIGPEETKKFVGDGYRRFVERAFRSFRGADEAVPEEAYSFYNTCFEENCLYRVDAYDGIRDLLAALKEKTIRTAVVSNKGQDRAVDNIESVFGRGYFDIVLGEQEGLPCKPSPAGPLYAAAVFGLTPGECLYIGDTNTDMKTGIAAGIDTVGVTWGFRDRDELQAYSPRYIVSHPSQILEILGR